MMLSFFVAAISSPAIVLQFDGSLRPPRDPIPGFTYFPSVSALDGSEKLASCSATISLHSPNDYGHEEKLIAVGGRYLPNVPGMTSADAEYDGLLLGLEWLVRTFSSEQENGYLALSEWNDASNDELQLLSPKLIIRGDCKTIIDQLKSRSIPRKTETKYNLAMGRIKSLKDMYAENQQRTLCENLDSADVSASNELSLCFEHVPRRNNNFCDAICRLVINQKQAEIVESIQDLIRLGEDEASKSTDSYVKRRHVKKSKKKRISHPQNDCFKNALNSIYGNPQLCHSSRLALACELAEASMRQKDAAVLSELSAFFLQMSRLWPRVYYLENDHDSVGKDTLRKVSIECEKQSNIFSGHTMEASFLADNRDLCLNGIASVFEFCTKNKYNYNDKGMDSTTHSSLSPYMNISAMINCIQAKSVQQELLKWDNLVCRHQKKV